MDLSNSDDRVYAAERILKKRIKKVSEKHENCVKLKKRIILLLCFFEKSLDFFMIIKN